MKTKTTILSIYWILALILLTANKEHHLILTAIYIANFCLASYLVTRKKHKHK